MAVPVQNPVASFTANGVTTVFPYAYLLLSADDLQVTLDGVALTAGFTVSGVGSVVGGNVTFSVAPVSGTLILRRKMSLSRLVDYVEAGDLLAATLNLDLDRIWMVLQGLEADSSRSIKLPEETLTAQEITEDAATRASKLLGFDVAGNVATMDLFDPAALIVTAYIESLLAAGSASTARTVLAAAADSDVVKLTGAQTVAGVKTFSSTLVLPGDASTALQAVPKQQLDAVAAAAAAAAVAPATLAPTLNVLAASQALTGLTSVLFSGIPAWVTCIRGAIVSASIADTAVPVITIGDSGGLETSGYSGAVVGGSSGASPVVSNLSAAFQLKQSSLAAQVWHSQFTLLKEGGDRWSLQSMTMNETGVWNVAAGSKTLSGALTQLQVGVSGGAGGYDAGTCSIVWS